ncbi:MAG TPA: acyl carrier protein [Stenomitos sp.]
MPTAPITRQALEDWLVERLTQDLNLEQEIDVRRPFSYYGLDSVMAISLAADLEDMLGRELEPTLLWDFPTIEALAAFLVAA